MMVRGARGDHATDATIKTIGESAEKRCANKRIAYRSVAQRQVDDSDGGTGFPMKGAEYALSEIIANKYFPYYQGI